MVGYVNDCQALHEKRAREMLCLLETVSSARGVKVVWIGSPPCRAFMACCPSSSNVVPGADAGIHK